MRGYRKRQMLKVYQYCIQPKGTRRFKWWYPPMKIKVRKWVLDRAYNSVFDHCGPGHIDFEKHKTW